MSPSKGIAEVSGKHRELLLLERGCPRPQLLSRARVPSSPEAGHVGMRESPRTDVRLQARGLVRVLAGEFAKRGRYLAAASDGELHPQHVGMSLRRSRRDPESVGDLDIRATLR
jgi:hypothetical protein